jgi:sulfite reductase alpha subunit
MPNQLFPFKLKIKFSACPLDCARAAARSDFGLIGLWEGAPDVDQPLLKNKAETGEVDVRELVERCPSKAITWDEATKALKIDGSRCAKSMNCIRSAFPAIKPGKNRKIGLFAGGKAKGRFGPKMGKPVAILDDYRQGADFVVKAIELWMDTSPHKDRLGDMLIKLGYKKVMEQMKDSLPAALQGEQLPQSRVVNSPLLNDEEREMYANWARGVVRDYFGGENGK